jgi:hypothetical protein
MSFLFDPPLLVAGGAAIERLAPDHATATVAEWAMLAVFIGTSTALYANVPGLGLLWRPYGSTSGRDFMLNSGMTRFRHDRPPLRTHLLAAVLFATYPLWLRAGRRLATRR